MSRQRTRDFYEPPNTDIVYGISALVVGLAMLGVRWLARALPARK